MIQKIVNIYNKLKNLWIFQHFIISQRLLKGTHSLYSVEKVYRLFKIKLPDHPYTLEEFTERINKIAKPTMYNVEEECHYVFLNENSPLFELPPPRTTFEPIPEGWEDCLWVNPEVPQELKTKKDENNTVLIL